MYVVSEQKYVDSNCEYVCVDVVQEIQESNDSIAKLEIDIEESYKKAYVSISHYSKEYFQSVSYLPNMYYVDNRLTNSDYQSKYVNIVNALRLLIIFKFRLMVDIRLISCLIF